MSVRVLFALLLTALPMFAADPEPTKEFRVKDDRATLGGKPIKLWGLRCGNALYDDTITERHIKNLDSMATHGINAIGVYIQGSNGGFPDAEAGLNGFTRYGKIKPAVGKRGRMCLAIKFSIVPPRYLQITSKLRRISCMNISSPQQHYPYFWKNAVRFSPSIKSICSMSPCGMCVQIGMLSCVMPIAKCLG